MKWRMISTAFVSVALLVNAAIFGLFPSVRAQGFGMLIMMISVLLLFANALGAYRLWQQYKVFALLPLCILLGSCAASIPMGRLGFDIRIKHFKSNQSKYDAIVSRVVSGEIPNPAIHEIVSSKLDSHYVAFRTPAEYRELVPYLITADREGTNTVAVRLVLCVMFPPHHHAYLWCPDGQFEKRLRKWERISANIDDKWCAIVD